MLEPVSGWVSYLANTVHINRETGTDLFMGKLYHSQDANEIHLSPILFFFEPGFPGIVTRPRIATAVVHARIAPYSVRTDTTAEKGAQQIVIL